MKKTSLVAVIGIAVFAFASCHHNPPAAPPSRSTTPATPPPAPPPSAGHEIETQRDDYAALQGKSADEIDRMGLLQEIHFEFDRADIRDADRGVLAKNAEVLKKFDFIKVTVEGHCDERGTVEYNLALGQRRAQAALDYLVSLGVPAARLKTVSYGKEFPVCQQNSEDCWQRNRRDRFAVTGKASGR
jgi:peptidoglycan-associated lipoprotein